MLYDDLTLGKRGNEVWTEHHQVSNQGKFKFMVEMGGAPEVRGAFCPGLAAETIPSVQVSVWMK